MIGHATALLKSCETLQRNIQKVQARLQRQQENAGLNADKSAEEIEARLLGERERINMVKLAFTKVLETLRMLRQDYLKLMAFENQLYEDLKLQINNAFDNLLLGSDSIGLFDLDRDNKTLEIRLAPKKDDYDVNDLDFVPRYAPRTRVQELSGVNLIRTMQTFLLSIIQTAPTPFFIIDEVYKRCVQLRVVVPSHIIFHCCVLLVLSRTFFGMKVNIPSSASS